MPCRYFIRLSYKGTNYHGWQIQPNAISIQETLNNRLSVLLNENIYVIGAGRTDTGVHAPCFFAHFDSDHEYLSKNNERLLYKLNCILPPDIAIQNIRKVQPEAHARFGALSRTYLYRLGRRKDPFALDDVYFYPKQLDMERMNSIAQILFEYTDFTSFSKLHSETKTNNCKIIYARWESVGDEWHFTIKADRFLRNMVRAIVGTLLDAGRGKVDELQFRSIIESKSRANSGTSVEAKGLHLIDIEYFLLTNLFVYLVKIL